MNDFWCNSRQVLTARFKFDEEKKLLQQGQVCLLFRGRAVGGEEARYTHHQLVHIAHHCFSPWRPTFTLCRAVPADIEKVLSLQPAPELLEDQSYISFEIETLGGNELVFASPHQLASRLDLDLCWQVCFLELSRRPVPFHDAYGMAKAKFTSEVALPIWAGREHELQQRQRGHNGEDDADVWLEPLEPDDDGAEAAVDDEVEADDLPEQLREFVLDLDEIAQQAGMNVLEGERAPSRSSSTSSTSSSSSSGSTSTSSAAMRRRRSPSAQHPMRDLQEDQAAAPAAPAAPPLARGRERRHIPVVRQRRTHSQMPIVPRISKSTTVEVIFACHRRGDC